MTGQAVALGVAADARLQALTRRLAVPGDEETPGVVVAGSQDVDRNQPGSLVAGRAERPRVMAIAARGLARIRGCRVAREEPVRVIAAAGGCGIGTMALEAIGANMTARAARRRRASLRAMAIREILAVTRRSLPRSNGRRPLVRSKPGGRARWRGSGMALIAEFAGVAGGAARTHRLARHGAVTTPCEEIGIRVRRWRLKPGDVSASQRHGAYQGHVTGRACGIGRGEVRRTDPMARKTALHDRFTHGHPRFAGLCVTSRAGR